MISSGIVAQHTFEIGLGTICGTQNALLEVGAGSGYAAAVLGHIASEVYAIERFASLWAMAHWVGATQRRSMPLWSLRVDRLCRSHSKSNAASEGAWSLP
jgi:hypothetical protein